MDYKLRREKLLSQLPDYSIAVINSGKAPYSIGDEKYPFKVNRNFYYFTGIEEENLVLMLVKLAGTTKETLFIEPFDEVQAKWVGGKILPARAKELSSIEDIKYVDQVESTIGSLVNGVGRVHQFTLWGDLTKQHLTQENEVADLFNKVRMYQPDVEIKNLFELTAKLRNVKDDEEIALMLKAIEVTDSGIRTMMSYSREGVWENELEAYFDFVLKCNQCEHAFKTICATGKNATVLHYSENNQYARENALVLCDLGAAYKNYNADITRTFPVNGKFTERQALIYDIVLRGNKLIIAEAKPGETTASLNAKLIEFYNEELGKIGLLENGKTVRDYYWHGVSHHLGLETHDVSLMNEPLVPGCVITVEPGLYLEGEEIGIRIEDDVLITEEGCTVLSKNIIKEVYEIENFMASLTGNLGE